MDKPYVGFWWRFLALIIDSIILMIAFAGIGLAIGVSMFTPEVDPTTGMPQISGLAMLVQFGGPILYYGVMQASPMQATVGKMAIGAIVTDAAGNRLGYGRSFGRELAKIPSMMVLMIGYLMVAFTGRKQGLHDIMAGTLVMKKRMAMQAHQSEQPLGV